MLPVCVARSTNLFTVSSLIYFPSLNSSDYWCISRAAPLHCGSQPNPLLSESTAGNSGIMQKMIILQCVLILHGFSRKQVDSAGFSNSDNHFANTNGLFIGVLPLTIQYFFLTFTIMNIRSNILIFHKFPFQTRPVNLNSIFYTRKIQNTPTSQTDIHVQFYLLNMFTKLIMRSISSAHLTHFTSAK